MNKYLKEAIEQYEQRIESGEPFYMDASVLMDIEEYYEKEGKNYEAERLMRFAEKLHPDSEDVLVVKAYRLKTRGKWSEALALVKSIPNQLNRDVQLFYAEWDVASGRHKKAEERIASCLTTDASTTDYDWYLDFSEILLDYGFQNLAIKYLNKMPANYQFRSRVDELLADAYFQLQQYDKSIEAGNRMVDANPYDADSWVQLADIQQKCEQFQNCVQSCDYALALDADNQRAMSLKVFALFSMQNYDLGMECCKEYIKKCPNDYSLRMYVGEQLYSLKQNKDALRFMQDALRLCPLDNPDHARIINDLVYALISENQHNEVKDLILNLCMLGTSPSEAYIQLAGIYVEFKNVNKAIETLEAAITLPSITEKDCLSITQLLAQHNYWKEAPTLWRFLANYTYSPEYATIYVYAAYALFIIRDKEAFNRAMKMAQIMHYPLLIEFFGNHFKTFNEGEILLKIKTHFEKE